MTTETMNTQIETANAEQVPTRWQKTLTWLSAVEAAMNYDPQENANTSIKSLRADVDRLNKRLNEVEGCEQRAG